MSARLWKSLLVLLALAAIGLPATGFAAEGAASSSPTRDRLARGFAQPPDSAKPWAYWWWVNGNVTKESITRDLEAMKAKGFAGLLMFDSRGYHDDHVPPPPPKTEFMSDEWRELLKFAMTEANRLGLEMSVNLSSGAGALKGPWDVGDDAPKKLVWASQEVTGPKKLEGELPKGDWSRGWDVAIAAVRHGAAPGGESARPLAAEVVDLSGKVDNGRLTWDVPEGRWSVLRFACTTMEGHETDVDILSAPAVTTYFNRMGGNLLGDAGPLAGKTLTHFYSVSWEGAIPTWTIGFEKQFEELRGYSLVPYLPVLAGFDVESTAVTERLLRDYHRTLADAFTANCYGRLRELSNKAGLKWHSESGGPWTRSLPTFKHADQLAFLGQNDMPQGEFWYPKRGFNRPIAMAAHIYGQRLAAAEAFTHMVGHWSVYPSLLKPLADRAYCDGINHLVWHTFTASPVEFGQPGIEYFAGTHVNPNVTWFEQSGALLAYLARCQFLLRHGRFVADACCYVGDQPYLHWDQGQSWTAKPTLSLPEGYTYDLVNTEVLLERLRVEKGDLVLPDGMRYRMLIVDLEDETVQPAALEKIAELAEAGATVVLGSRRPDRAPGLENYPACDAEIRKLAARLWGGEAQGQGRVVADKTLAEVLAEKQIAPDFEGPWPYTHRRVGDAEIYFLAGSGEAECTFRVKDKEPELWDPLTGTIRDAVMYRVQDGRTIVPIRLPENGSIFVVFRRPAEKLRLVSGTGPQPLEVRSRQPDAVAVRLWQNGRYQLETSADKELTAEVSSLAEPVALAGPWEVRFAPGWGAPEKTTFEKLISWTDHPDEAIKHFSGRATYRQQFELSPSQAKGLVRLQLGDVKHVAEVRLNGSPLGVVWTAPWTVDLTGHVKSGNNDLEIDVVNVWMNRLIGDAKLPPEQRRTKTNILLQTGPTDFRRFKGYSSADELTPSGLLGPVQLEFGEERVLPF